MTHKINAQNIGFKFLDASDNSMVYDVQILGFDADTSIVFSTYNDPDESFKFVPKVKFYYFNHINYKPLYKSYTELKETNIVLLQPNGTITEEVTITASRFRDRKNRTSLNLEKLNTSKINSISSTNSIDLIERTNNVYVQKSQPGGGSPVLRGFEANKIVLSINGIKLNNAIYRGGHLQNALSVGNNLIRNIEIVTGPGSIIYGSDALGGVINFNTEDEIGIEERKLNLTFTGAGPTGAVGMGIWIIEKHTIGKRKLTQQITGGFQNSYYGKYRMGKWRPGNKELWGALPFTVKKYDSFDLLSNNKVATNLPRAYSGYEQQDFLLEYALTDQKNRKYILHFNYSEATNIPRFDRLNDFTPVNNLKFSVWKYGIQERAMAYFRFSSQNKTNFYDELKSTIAFQHIKESRIRRKFDDALKTNQKEKVNIISYSIDALKNLNNINAELQYGIESIYNLVNSSAFTKNVWEENNMKLEANSRYPDGNNYTLSLDNYILYRQKISEKTDINTGIRFSNYILKIAYDTPPFSDLSINERSINSGITYSFGLKFKPNNSTTFKTNVSSGFRAPNIDDTGKIFDPAPNILVIPNTNVKPEYVYNFDLSLKQRLSSYAQLEAGTYFSRARNLIRRMQSPAMDSIQYEGEVFAVYSNKNVGKANLAGCYANLSFYSKNRNFETNHNIHYTYGRDLSNKVPLGHIPPLYGKSEIILKNKLWHTQLWTFWNAAKKLKHYSPFSEDKLEEATPNGTPAWANLNFQITKYLSFKKAREYKINISFSVENIMDLHYVPFSSGIAASGRNFKFKILAEL